VAQNGTPVAAINALAVLGERLGVPAFVLAVLMLTLAPRIDHGLAVAERVDAELSIIVAQGCFAPPAAGAP
jgi:hypothetical protein